MFQEDIQKLLKKGWVCKMKDNNLYGILRNIFAGAFIMIGVGYLIILYFSKMIGEFSPAPIELVEKVGVLRASEMLAFYSALAGAVFGGTKFIWKIESWSILKSSVVYFTINLIVMTFCGYRMYWFAHTINGYISFLAIFIGIFIAIWIMCYLRGKSQADEMNNKLKDIKK